MEFELTRVQGALTSSEGVWLKAESELDFVKQALAAANKACRKAEEEICRLTDERLSLIMELGASKEELPAFQAKVVADSKEMEEEFDASSDVIFNYGYGCCAFVHDICGSKSMIPAGMLDTSESLPPEFFVNPRCLPSASSDPPCAAVAREEPPASSPLVVVDGIDTLSKPSDGVEG